MCSTSGFALIFFLLIGSITVRADRKPIPRVILQERGDNGSQILTVENPRTKEVKISFFCGIDNEEPVVIVTSKSTLKVKIESNNPPVECSIGHWEEVK